LHCLFDCTKEFELDVAVTDADLSLMQECVALSTEHPGLSRLWTDAIAYVCALMNARQRNWFAFDRMYSKAVETAVFGTEDDPVVVGGEEYANTD
jgi:hypothetical protein